MQCDSLYNTQCYAMIDFRPQFHFTTGDRGPLPVSAGTNGTSFDLFWPERNSFICD